MHLFIYKKNAPFFDDFIINFLYFEQITPFFGWV